MIVEIKMPRLGLTMKEGIVQEWYKSEGEFIEKGEVICLIANDKMTSELESPINGFLVMRVQEGETFSVQTVIAEITKVDDEEQSVSKEERLSQQQEVASVIPQANEDDLSNTISAEHNHSVEQSPQQVATVLQMNGGGDDLDQTIVMTKPLVNVDDDFGKIEKIQSRTNNDRQDATSEQVEQELKNTVEEQGMAYEDDGVQATPIARRMAKKLGIDLTSIQGTGGAGRIVKEDVKEAQLRLEKAESGAQQTIQPTEAVKLETEMNRLSEEQIPLKDPFQDAVSSVITNQPNMDRNTNTNDFVKLGSTEEPIVEQLEELPTEEPVVEQLEELPAEEPIVEQLEELPAEELVVEQLEELPTEELVVEQKPFDVFAENSLATMNSQQESVQALNEEEKLRRVIEAHEVEHASQEESNHAMEEVETLDTEKNEKVEQSMHNLNEVKTNNPVESTRVMKKLMKQPIVKQHAEVASVNSSMEQPAQEFSTKDEKSKVTVIEQDNVAAVDAENQDIKDTIIMNKSIRITALESYQQQLHQQLQFINKKVDVPIKGFITRAVIIALQKYSESNAVLLYDGHREKYITVEESSSVISLSERLNDTAALSEPAEDSDLLITAAFEEISKELVSSNQSAFKYQVAYKLSNDVNGTALLTLLLAINAKDISRESGREILREIILNLENPMLLFL